MTVRFGWLVKLKLTNESPKSIKPRVVFEIKIYDLIHLIQPIEKAPKGVLLFWSFYLLKILNIFNTFRNTIYKITKMATVSSVISSVKSWVSNNLSKYLPLGGGKMTGIITYVHTGLSIGTNPTSTQYKAIHWTDKTGDAGNNNRLATVEYYCGNTGTSGLTIGPMQYIANRGNYNGSLLQLSITPDGAKSISWDGKPVVCVTRWTSGTSWYRVYSDGWIEQGGYFNCSANGTTITYHKAFSNTNYYLNGNGSQTTAGARFVSFYNRTTTGSACYTGDDSSFNAGYVYWYASGY